MRITRVSLVGLSLVLILGVVVSALAEPRSGRSASESKHHSKPVRVHVSWKIPTRRGARVSGRLSESGRNCRVSARSRSGIEVVTFYRDGKLLNKERYAPYSCVWDTTKVANGSSHILRAVARDKRGHRASASIGVKVRRVNRPPQTTITRGPSGRIGTDTASFSFSASDTGSSFECRLDGEPWAGCSSPNPYSGLADGAHSFQVRATDAAGKTDATPARRGLTVDTSAPIISWTTPEGGAAVSGRLSEGAHNCTASPGSSFRIDRVSFYLDGALLNTERSAPYSCTWDTTAAADGSSHTLGAVVYDINGRSASESVSVTVNNAPPPDTTPPQTTITGGPSGTIGTDTASFSFSSSELGSSFECRLDGEPWAGCSSPKPEAGLADGSHSFEARATDGAGNTDASPASRSFTVDTSPPTVAWTTPQEGDTVSGQMTESRQNCIISTGSSAGIDHMTFSLDGTVLNTDRLPPYSCVWDTTTAADGSSHTLEAVAYDANGRSAAASVSVTVNNTRPPDTTPPETTISAGPSGTITTGNASFSFSSSEPGSSFQCRLDGGSWALCSSPKAYSGLADGDHTFEVRAIDAAGNTDASAANRSFGVDTSGGSGGAGYPSLARRRLEWQLRLRLSARRIGLGSVGRQRHEHRPFGRIDDDRTEHRR